MSSRPHLTTDEQFEIVQRYNRKQPIGHIATDLHRSLGAVRRVLVEQGIFEGQKRSSEPHYSPTSQQIAAATAKIRKTWNKETRCKRVVGLDRSPLTVPRCSG